MSNRCPIKFSANAIDSHYKLSNITISHEFDFVKGVSKSQTVEEETTTTTTTTNTTTKTTTPTTNTTITSKINETDVSTTVNNNNKIDVIETNVSNLIKSEKHIKIFLKNTQNYNCKHQTDELKLLDSIDCILLYSFCENDISRVK